MRRALLSMLGVAVISLAASAQAATTSGKMVAMDTLTNSLTIQTEDGRRFTFVRTSVTKIERDGITIALADLEQGSNVTVTSDQEPTSSSQPVALRVEVEEPIAAAADPETSVVVESAEREETRVARLPSTATPLPAIALVGAGSLMAGLVLRYRRR